MNNIALEIKGLTKVIAIAAGDNHSLALKEDGTVWAFGLNSSGQLGDGSTLNKVKPVQVKGLTDVKQIVASSGHNLALKNDGTVWSRGFEQFGLTGVGRSGEGSQREFKRVEFKKR